MRRTETRIRQCAVIAVAFWCAFNIARAHAGTAFQEVWYPDGVINWFIDDVTNAGTNNININRGMNYLASRTPLQLTQVFNRNAANLRFSRGRVLPGNSGMTAFYWRQGRDDGRKVIELGDTGVVGMRTILHEMGHALGMAHEFQRPERAEFVSMCVYADGYNFGRIGRVPIPGAHWNLSPYDLQSITNSGYDCQQPSPRIVNPMSRHDVNSLYRMYARPLGRVSDGAAFGHAVATGDFDGDEIEDIAIAAAEPVPESETGSAGWVDLRVYFFRGVMTDPTEEPGVGTSYVSWFREDVRRVRSDSAGLTLHSGDFNGDGIGDLAVGEPYFFGNRGRVTVWFVNVADDAGDSNPPWGRRGIRHQVTVSPPAVGLGVSVARLGASMSSGRLTAETFASERDTPDDLIIGAPGAPGGGGAIIIRGVSDPTAGTWTPTAFVSLVNPGPAGAEFGAAVSTIEGMCEAEGIDKDVPVIGAPGWNGNRGSIAVYPCVADAGGNLIAPAPLRLVAHNQVGARYGAAVAGFRTRSSANVTNYRYYLAVGTPGFAGDDGIRSGKVYLDEFTRDGVKTYISSFRPGVRAGDDLFGAQLAIHQHPASAVMPEGGREVRIAIGMPGAADDGVRTGKVYVWRPWTATNEIRRTAAVFRPSRTVQGVPALFGTALATLRDLDGFGGFVTGNPGGGERRLSMQGIRPQIEDVAAGNADILLNNAANIGAWQTERIHLSQGTGADRRPLN